MSPRILCAVLAVAVVSFATAGRLFLQIADFYTTAASPDGVTEFESRFEQLRTLLPARGVIGYMADEDLPAGDANAQAEFFLTQYAIAPVIVVRQTNQPFVIGNFKKMVTTGSMRDKGFKLIREFGRGIALFENERFNKGAGR